MRTAFETALMLNLQPELDSKDRETLEYMTRSQDYDFQTKLGDLFFTECGQTWRNIIANTNIKEYEQESCAQIHRSMFSNSQLCFRIIIDDDTYWGGDWFMFLDWLFSISTNEGLVGYAVDLFHYKTELIYFKKSGEDLQVVEELKIPALLNVEMIPRETALR